MLVQSCAVIANKAETSVCTPSAIAWENTLPGIFDISMLVRIRRIMKSALPLLGALHAACCKYTFSDNHLFIQHMSSS